MVVYAADKLNHREQAHGLLLRAAHETWNFKELPSIDRTVDGKPFFSDHPDHHFNLSHSGALALCALDSAPAGADIQIVKDSWRDALPRRVCSPNELEWLKEQCDFWPSFTLLWTLKEARAKYTGTGLKSGVRGISIPLPIPEQSLYRHDGLWFRIYTGTGWKAAVCGETEPPEQLIWV